MEKEIVLDEAEIGLEKLDYETFIYSLKRYGFNKTHLSENVLILAAEELKLDLKSLNYDSSPEEQKKSYDREINKVLKSPFYFENGRYDIKRLQALAFLYCKHKNLSERRSELW